MAAKLSDLSPTPEEFIDSNDRLSSTANNFLTHGRSAYNLHLQERLLTAGNHGTVDAAQGRMGRRPSVGSLGVDHDDNNTSSYFNLLRRVSHRLLTLGLEANEGRVQVRRVYGV